MFSDEESSVYERLMKKETPMARIRAKCLDCCCNQPSEVRLCEAKNCPL